jgi:hypothetical protein
MVRTLLLAAVLALTAQTAMADANLVVLTGKGAKPSTFGYAFRAVEHGKKVTVYLELTPAAAKAFGHGELHLMKGGQTVLETTVTISKDAKGNGILKLTIDPHAVNGGELVIWSGHIDGAPAVVNFGGFRISIADLMAATGEDRAEAVMKAMDGFRKTLPEAQGLGEMNGRGVPDIAGNAHPDTHLRGIATRLGVKTRAECLALMTYLKDPDPKLRRIAAFALEGVEKAYPNGMSSSDMQDVESEGHRAMVRKFTAGIEKLAE